MSLLKKNTSLIPRSSFFNDLFDDERFWNFDFGSKLMSKVPAANFREEEKAFFIELAVPGMKKEDFKVEMDHNTLTISAERTMENEEKEEHYERKEFNYSSFSRSFTLPEAVNTEKIAANYHDGILQFELPKKPKAKENKRKAIVVK